MRLPSDLPSRPIPERVRALFALLAHGGDADYIGEPVSQLQHALQAAASASRTGDAELVLAALFHDLGHLADPTQPSMDGLGTVDHQGIGESSLLACGFSSRVASIVGAHVDAKRYQVARRPGYRERLSPASAQTLVHQGGAMTDVEAAVFEAQPHFRAALAVRGYDERAKDPDLEVPGLAAYEDMLRRHLEAREADVVTGPLDRDPSAEEIEMFRRDHRLVLRGVLAGEPLLRLTQWVEDFEARPETPGKWMKYFERVDGVRRLCRVEDLLPHHAGFADLLAGPRMLHYLSCLLGEPTVLFKEKINLKSAGGAGFQAHQDAPAFDTFGQTYHVTVCITVDPSDESNGGLEFSDPVPPGHVLPQDAGGAVHPDTETELPWHPVPLPAGSLLIFDSWIPHRSGPNVSDGPRRALFTTYNRAADGERRADYYADKRRVFPPDVEREPGIDYAAQAGRYNLGNPIE